LADDTHQSRFLSVKLETNDWWWWRECLQLRLDQSRVKFRFLESPFESRAKNNREWPEDRQFVHDGRTERDKRRRRRVLFSLYKWGSLPGRRTTTTTKTTTSMMIRTTQDSPNTELEQEQEK